MENISEIKENKKSRSLKIKRKQLNPKLTKEEIQCETFSEINLNSENLSNLLFSVNKVAKELDFNFFHFNADLNSNIEKNKVKSYDEIFSEFLSFKEINAEKFFDYILENKREELRDDYAKINKNDKNIFKKEMKVFEIKEDILSELIEIYRSLKEFEGAVEETEEYLKGLKNF